MPFPLLAPLLPPPPFTNYPHHLLISCAASNYPHQPVNGPHRLPVTRITRQLSSLVSHSSLALLTNIPTCKMPMLTAYANSPRNLLFTTCPCHSLTTHHAGLLPLGTPTLSTTPCTTSPSRPTSSEPPRGFTPLSSLRTTMRTRPQPLPEENPPISTSLPPLRSPALLCPADRALNWPPLDHPKERPPPLPGEPLHYR